jgi:hypothetical protein
MGKEFFAERQRVERRRMRNHWFYVTSLLAIIGIVGWMGGERLWSLFALISVLGLNLVLPLETYVRLGRASARDRKKKESRLRTG